MGINNITRAEWDILYERFDLEGNSRVRKFSILYSVKFPSFLCKIYVYADSSLSLISNSYYFLDAYTVHGFGARTISSGIY